MTSDSPDDKRPDSRGKQPHSDPRRDPAGKKAAPEKRKTGKKPGPSKTRMYQRPRGGEAKLIADLMPEIGRTAFRRFGFVQSSVVTRWPEIAGARYCAISLPESIRFPQGKKSDGTLHLIVNGAHAVLMQHVGPEIIDRVNRFFGYPAVARVKFRQGDVTPPRSAPPIKPPRPLKPVPVALGDGLRDIGDAELLAVLASLAQDIASAEEDARAPDDAARGEALPPKDGQQPGKADMSGSETDKA